MKRQTNSWTGRRPRRDDDDDDVMISNTDDAVTKVEIFTNKKVTNVLQTSESDSRLHSDRSMSWTAGESWL